MPSLHQFGPVTVDTLGKGETRKQLDTTLDAAAQALHDFCLEHGYDFTQKTKAEVTLRVTFMHHESGLFSVKATVGEKLPVAPAKVLPLVTQNGRILAPLAEELDENDDPRQMTLAHVAPGDHAAPRTKEM